MRRGRIFIYLGLILILGLVAVAVVVFRNQQATPVTVGVEGTPVVPESPKESVVVIAQPVKRGQRITEDVLAVVQISVEDVLQGMVLEEDMDQIIGSFARYDLEAGVYVTEGVLVDQADGLSSAGSDHAIFIPPGMVAVSIPVDRLSSVAYGVQRGDHVNVIVTLLMVDLDSNYQSILPNNSSSILAPGPALLATVTQEQTEGPDQLASALTISELIQTLTAQVITGGAVAPIGRLELDQALGQPFYVVPSESQRPRLVSQTLIQNVIVLQMGNFTIDSPVAVEPTPAPEGEEAPAEETGGDQAATTAPQTIVPDTVTLIVSPQDAVTLNYLLINPGARLSLALRSAGDESQIVTEAVTLQFLVDQYRIPVPSKLPYGLEPRLDLIVPPTLLNDQVVEPQQ
ncbi:MAG: hypothetical protein HUU38_19165 [Anaerolineales bacterium]|nr:hypothetical protein [Anaerolineales bacterium]